MRALPAAACMHVHRRHLVLMACRKFGVTTPDIKAIERERGERKRTAARGEIAPRKILVQGYLIIFNIFSLLGLYQQVPASSLRVARVKGYGSSPGFKL